MFKQNCLFSKFCIPRGNNLSYIALCWNMNQKLRNNQQRHDGNKWVQLMKLLKVTLVAQVECLQTFKIQNEGVVFYKPVCPMERVKCTQITGYTVFAERVSNGTMGRHKLTVAGNVF